MARKLVEMEWRQYAERVLPPDAPRVQMMETRRAYYAGAASLLNLIMRHASPGDEITAEDDRLMDDIQAELDGFLRDVLAGRK